MTDTRDLPAHLHAVQFSEPPEANGDDVGYLQGYRSEEQEGWFKVEYATGSDYSGSSVHRSNYRVLCEMLREEHSDGPVVWVRTSGGYGTYGIAVRYFELCETIRETLDACEDYCLIDENDHSQLECDEQDECWERWARQDFIRELAKALDKDSSALADVLTSDQWYAVFHAMAEASGTYWEDQGGEGPYIDLRRLVSELVKRVPQRTRPRHSSDDEDDALEALYAALPKVEAARESGRLGQGSSGVAMTYRISSHSSARYSSVHGSAHPTMGDALRALDDLADHTLTAAECGSGEEWMVYQTEDDAQADTDGREPHLAIARIVRE